MKILCVQCTALIAFMMLVPQPATAFEGTRLGQQEPDKNQVKQRGQQNRELKPWEARPWDPKPSASKPWESRPWDSASEEARPKDLRSGEERKAADERRRVGRKARKERSKKGKYDRSQQLSGSRQATSEQMAKAPDGKRAVLSHWHEITNGCNNCPLI